ncbi:MAG: 50S ribosomal protein L24 [Defluviitaleaceae bacterium]|nr:50S ribosomal protein L24 [Defluviitaleaceae bacterium]
MKLKVNDNVVVIAGKLAKEKKQGKILKIDRAKNKIIVEGVNVITKHQKQAGPNKPAGIIKTEAPIDASNVMYLHKGKPTRLGYQVTEQNGKKVKKRVAKTTGELID